MAEAAPQGAPGPLETAPAGHDTENGETLQRDPAAALAAEFGRRAADNGGLPVGQLPDLFRDALQLELTPQQVMVQSKDN